MPNPSPPRSGLRVAAVACLTLLGAVAIAPPVAARFVDRTAERGLTWLQSTWGAALVDLDGDGDLDLYAGHHFFEPVLHWNDGAGYFDSTLHAQVWLGDSDRHGVLAVSLDLDEDPDLFVTHGGGGGANPEENELYRNDGDGVLRSLGGAGGMGDPSGRSRAASAADFDGDGKIDVWVGKAPAAASFNSLFRNVGTFQFSDVAATAGLDETAGTVGGIWGDFDGDGDPDLFVGGEEFARPSILWRNDDGVFSDASASFTPPLPVVSGADWGDFDEDGDFDLAVCDGEIGIFDAWSEGDTLSFFFNSRYGDAGFDGLTIPATADSSYAMLRVRGVADSSLVFLGPAGVHPETAAKVLLTDDWVGSPTFTPGVDQGIFVWRTLPGGPWVVFCSTPNLNFDAFDGWLTQGAPISGTTPIGLEDPGFTPGTVRVWRNDGGSFAEVSASLGLPTALVNPRDVSWVDWDNDGDLDLHVVDLGTSAVGNAPDALFRNDGPTFSDATREQGLAGGPAGLGDGAVWGDVDGDGDLDLYLAEGAGPAAFSELGPGRLFLNEEPHGPSLQVTLVGRQSGKPAVGTVATVVLGSRRLTRVVTANSWRGFQDPLRLHFGLDGAAAADSLIIEWTSGTVDAYSSVPAGIVEFTEGVDPTDAAVVAPGPPAATWSVAGPWPQPFRGVQRLRIRGGADLRATVTVHDVAGRLVRTLPSGARGGADRLVTWDGRDRRGRAAPAGVYWLRVTDGKRTEVRRSVLLR